MKVLLIIISVVICIFSLNGGRDQTGIETGNKDQAIKLQVRVRFNNQWVGGLKKEDFKVYENGKLKQLLDFTKYEKSLGPEGNTRDTGNGSTVSEPRQFLLMFYFIDFNEKLQQGINYLFEKIVRKNDLLTILVNNMLIKEHRVIHEVSEKKQLTNFLKKVGAASGPKLKKLFYEMEILLQQAIRGTIAIPVSREQHPAYLPERLIKNSAHLEKYIGYLNFYKNNFVLPNVKRVLGFAQNQKSKNREKWVIHFFQMETFPLIKLSRKDKSSLRRIISDSMSFQVGPCADSARQFKRSLDRVIFAINLAAQYPDEKLNSFFYKENATFYTVVIPPASKEVLKDGYYRKTFSELKSKLDKLTRLNGGELIVSQKPEKALAGITAKDDIIYTLSYTRETANKRKRKIEVKVDKKDHEVLFNR